MIGLPSAEHVSRAVRALNPQLYGDGEGSNMNVEKNAKRKTGMNDTEKRFALDHGIDFEAYECLTFVLAPGVRYTPDFSRFRVDGGRLICYEIKGGYIHNPQRARTKFLLARKLYPAVVWQAWQWTGGQWVEIWREHETADKSV